MTMYSLLCHFIFVCKYIEAILKLFNLFVYLLTKIYILLTNI